jgi:hypothetical protein
MLVVGLMVVLALPVLLIIVGFDPTLDGTVSGPILAVMALVAVGGIALLVAGFRVSTQVRGTHWIQLEPNGLQLWSGRYRRPVRTIPWTEIATARVTTDQDSVLWLRFERSADAWDLLLTLDPASGDPRQLEREIAGRLAPSIP